MEINRMETPEELGLTELIALLWDGKLLITAITVAFVILGGTAYFLLPRTFESRVSVFPLRQAQFAGYLGLTQEGDAAQQQGAFPYTPVTLHTEFSSYVRDFDRLTAIAMETSVVDRGTKSEAEYNLLVQRFVSAIKFERPNAEEMEIGQFFLNITAKADDQSKLTAFIQKMLSDANTDMARDLTEEVRRRAAEIKDKLEAETARLQVDIDARRKRVDDDRKDEMIRLGEQSAVAHSLGIEKPLDLRAIEAIEQGGAASAQINTNGQEQVYLQGYAALDERIDTLRNRKDSDPFVGDLRQLQQQIYALGNDPRPARILALLDRSPLADPATAMMVRFSLASATAEKVFPRLSVFGIASVFLGLLAGSGAVLLRRRTGRAPA